MTTKFYKNSPPRPKIYFGRGTVLENIKENFDK